MSIALPDSSTRWRCTRCGNLTRFDVVSSTRESQYWHFDLSGDHTIEQTTVLSGGIESVTCRWCSGADTVELIPRAAADD